MIIFVVLNCNLKIANLINPASFHFLMTKEFILLERKDLEKNWIKAVNPDSFAPSENTYKEFNEVGRVNGLEPNDFKYHDFWNHDYITIHPLGALGEDDEDLVKTLNKEFEDLSEKHTLNKQFLVEKSGLVRRVADFKLVNGDLYLARFIPDSQEQHGNNNRVSELYIVEPSETPLELVDKKLISGGPQKHVYDMAPYGIQITMNNISGNLELSKIGYMNATKVSLAPFKSIGGFGSTHKNLPRIIK
jgi:hypothetical protein